MSSDQRRRSDEKASDNTDADQLNTNNDCRSRSNSLSLAEVLLRRKNGGVARKDKVPKNSLALIDSLPTCLRSEHRQREGSELTVSINSGSPMKQSRHQSLDLAMRGSREEVNGLLPSHEGKAPRRLSLAENLRTWRAEQKPSKRQSSRKRAKKSRLVSKEGDCNVYCTNVPKMHRNYMRDIFTTLIDAKWRWILMGFSFVFTISWLAFAIFYFLITYFHDDLRLYGPKISEMELGGKNNTEDLSDQSSHIPCIGEVHSFTSAFLFSVETQHTIGYGHRYLTTHCPCAIIAVCFQCLLGLLIQSLMVGLVFAKISRPKKRAATLVFSRNAVISLQNGELCLSIRVADMRNTHLVEAHVRLQLITQRVTEEGEVEPLHQFEIDVGFDSGADRIFLVWPITICHIIRPDSPLYDLSTKGLPTAQFELIVLLEGIVESTGMTAQARTSYLPSEILWGHRFEKLVTYQKCNGSYKVDFGLFHNTYAVSAPKCSARQLGEMKKSGLQKKVSHAFFHKSDTEARLEANNGEEGPTPQPSPIPTPTPPTPPENPEHSSPFHHFFDKPLMGNGPFGFHKDARKSSSFDPNAHQSDRKLTLLRPPSLFFGARKRSNNARAESQRNKENNVKDGNIDSLRIDPPKIVVNSPGPTSTKFPSDTSELSVDTIGESIQLSRGSSHSSLSRTDHIIQENDLMLIDADADNMAANFDSDSVSRLNGIQWERESFTGSQDSSIWLSSPTSRN